MRSVTVCGLPSPRREVPGSSPPGEGTARDLSVGGLSGAQLCIVRLKSWFVEVGRDGKEQRARMFHCASERQKRREIH